MFTGASRLYLVMGDAIKKRKAADQPGANEQQIPLPERCLKELVLLLRPVWLAAGRPTDMSALSCARGRLRCPPTRPEMLQPSLCGSSRSTGC